MRSGESSSLWQNGQWGLTEKTFLIILQNSMEQRPTGGLIEGIGVAVFEKGKLLDISWSSPNDVEASLTGSEDAPFPIKSMLAQSKLLFRDANWAVDGPGSAARIKKCTNGPWAGE